MDQTGIGLTGGAQLHHYVVVRRDLPFGVLCAQLAHAAGESFFRLQILSRLTEDDGAAFESRRVDGGSNPPSGANTLAAGVAQCSEQRAFSLQVAGSNPASGSNSFFDSFDPSRTVAVVLGARNEQRLLRLQAQLRLAGVPFVPVREPDAPYCGQLMAIGLVPGAKTALSAHLNEFHMIRTLDEEKDR